jgi:hypothetical protein
MFKVKDVDTYLSERRKDFHNEKMKKLVEETEVMLKKMYLVRISQRRKKIIEWIWKK